MVIICSDPRDAGDPALSFPKCCLREPSGRTRSSGHDSKFHVNANGAFHKGCGKILMQVAIPLTFVFTSLFLVCICALDPYTGDVSCFGSRKIISAWQRSFVPDSA